MQKCSLKKTHVKSPEFIWKVDGLNIEDVEITESEYPFFEVKNAKIQRLKMNGKYSFQYDENIEMQDCQLNTKDAFWHAKNMIIRDSVIKGEYLAWYSENLTFINCKIIGTQPFCYCKNLVLQNCSMEQRDLAFERSEVKAEITSKIDSVKNPLKGFIKAPEIGEIIINEDVGGKTECEITAIQ